VPREYWHCCRCMRRTHAASWFFQSRVALSTSVPALRSLAVRSQSRTTSSLHVRASHAACVSLFLRTASAVANTPIRHQASATVKTRKTAVDRGRRSDRPRYRTTPITRVELRRCPLPRHVALLAALSQPLIGRHSKYSCSIQL